MSGYRDRLFGFLRSRAPGGIEDLLAPRAGGEAFVPSSAPATADDLVARFRSQLEAVGGEAVDLEVEEDSAGFVRGWIERRAAGPAAIDEDPAWDALGFSIRDLFREAGIELRIAGGATPPGELADLDLGVTIAEAAIAETGTIVQCARSFRPRSLSLVPSRHLVFVPRPRLVPGLEDFFRGVAERASWVESTARFDAYFTWITGPSRTADIEKTLTIGIHGPGELTVMFLSEETTA